MYRFQACGPRAKQLSLKKNLSRTTQLGARYLGTQFNGRSVVGIGASDRNVKFEFTG